MKREYGLDRIRRDDASVLTVGTFDGVHVGHRAILRYLLERASAQSGRSVVVSFHPHPRAVLKGTPVPLLTTIEERADVFESLGLDRFIVLEFTEAFSKLSAREFVEEILVERIGLQEIVIGYDHGFGRGREGDSRLLAELGRTHGFTVDVIPPQVVEEHVVSSSEIRALLEEGDVRLAAQLLGRRYTLRGRVGRGAARGRTIGFPTANLEVEAPEKVLPAVGVYAVRVRVAAEAFDGMMNIGYRPTFDGQRPERPQLEVHLLDFEGDLYERVLRVEFVERIRDERRFESVDALREQLSRDRARCKALLENLS